MVTSRGIGGGFLADDMGLGKTLSYLAYIVVERQLAVLHRNVAKSREVKDGQHLLVGQDGQCPTPPTDGWIICPCSASSPTSRMQIQPGLRMACVPAAVVKQWWDQWKLHVDTADQALGMKIAIDHPAVFKDNALTSADMLSSAAAAQTKNRMEPKKAAKGTKADDEPKENNDSILLVTTQEGFPNLVKEFSKVVGGYIRDSKDRNSWIKASKQNRCSLVFGIAMIDECHEAYIKNSGRAKVLVDLPRFNNSVRPFVWGYSGTPFSQTPRAIEGVLWAIEKHSDVIDEDFSWKKLDRISKQFDQQLKSKEFDHSAVDACLVDFKSFLIRYMIRRAADTLWFDHPLAKMKPHIHTDVSVISKLSFTEATRDYENQFDAEREEMLKALQTRWDETAPELRRSNIRPVKLAFNVNMRAYWRSRLLATLPYLQMLTSPDGEPLKLSTVEVLDYIQKKKTPRDSNSYKDNIKAIMENSPKCLWLHDFMIRLKGLKDVEGDEHKLVIMTAFPQVAYVVSLIIDKYFPEYKDLVGLIPGRMRPSEKVNIINAFTGKADDKNSQKGKKDLRILIGLTRIIGVGLQLQRACHVIVMEPDYEFIYELQAYGRVHRIGQRNPMSRSFRLIDGNSEIESKILQRQVDRKEVAGTKINEVEVHQTEVRLFGENKCVEV
ncbi:hypothetical protein ONS95_002842 [Cadophora gregata]|uniref:uncharacterized protein n=1 Tax=Cadophora gregata TaxID=51156 RepID=UPI0026DC0C90|nr:uncharacterized protein ONS95_002842 [Cadophora gregata]KAK0110191.1 hypothetical protein ONS95_002842 [Cadophora gregata]KAK0110192.1 hypothetical protein ONS96_001815 [Cadophora gregata f. sp. sojae]